MEDIYIKETQVESFGPLRNFFSPKYERDRAIWLHCSDGQSEITEDRMYSKVEPLLVAHGRNPVCVTGEVYE